MREEGMILWEEKEKKWCVHIFFINTMFSEKRVR
jgi:hypothetical protein